MRSRIGSVVVITSMALMLVGCSAKLQSSADILDLQGDQRIDASSKFSSPRSWDLQYGYDCSRQVSEGIPDINRFDLIVYNGDDSSTASEHPELHLEGRKKASVLHFRRGGTYYLAVDSRCDWHVSVIDTST